MNSHGCIPINYAPAAFVSLMKVQTSYFDELYLKRDELDGIELDLHMGGIEPSSLASTYPWNLLSPALLIAIGIVGVSNLACTKVWYLRGACMFGLSWAFGKVVH